MLTHLLKPRNLLALALALGSVPVALCGCWVASAPMVAWSVYLVALED